MIDVQTETILTAKQACAAFPKHVSLPTLWRWMLKGTRGVVLESIRIGGRRYTSAEACSRFIQASAEDTPSPERKKQQRSMAMKQARAVLDQFGV